ncbi:MAG: YeiH family putative sulfate export transporter [Gallionella sp.]|nr:YeiH family putative sulfate export transporter [Gallionella sp.]
MPTSSKHYLSGIFLSLSIAMLSLLLGQNHWFQAHAIGALTLSILLGILIGNTVFPLIAHHSMSGVLFSKQRLLQLGIVLYGFRLTFADIAHIGLEGVMIDAMVLSSTFSLALFVGCKLLKLDINTVILIGAGSAICGAAAVMATEPVIRGRAEHVSVAVATVIVFGTLGMLLYPVLSHWNQVWHLLPPSPEAFGIFTGSTIHEVAQVVAAAKPLGDAATDTAVITKMVRVMMLAPFLILLSVYVTRTRPAISDEPKTAINLPWFALLFVAVIAMNSLAILPQHLVGAAINLDSLLLATAMAALGLCTHFTAISKAGYKPLLLGGILFAWLVLGGGLINWSMMADNYQ